MKTKISMPFDRVAIVGPAIFVLVLLFCVLCASFVNGQPPNDPAHRADSGLAAVSAYKLEWKKKFPFQVSLVPEASADDAGTLWLITSVGHGNPYESLTRIEPDGRVSGTYDPMIAIKPIEDLGHLTLATSGQNVGLLANITSGGRVQTVEGAFFLSMGREGLNPAKRIAGKGPQFLVLAGNGKGQFIAAGDQEPLTLLKLDAIGNRLWRRSFSKELVLPDVAVGANGNTFVLSEGDSSILIQVLAETGRLVKSKQIVAHQGTVVADGDGGCTILFSKGDGGKENRVYLSSLDPKMRASKEIETPLRGWSGRTYQLISTPRGHLAIGESAEEKQQIMVEFDKLGRELWQQEIVGYRSPDLVPFKSGFYLVWDGVGREGVEVEKYVY
jgi:hypothetical protein